MDDNNPGYMTSDEFISEVTLLLPRLVDLAKGDLRGFWWGFIEEFFRNNDYGPSPLTTRDFPPESRAPFLVAAKLAFG